MRRKFRSKYKVHTRFLRFKKTKLLLHSLPTTMATRSSAAQLTAIVHSLCSTLVRRAQLLTKRWYTEWHYYEINRLWLILNQKLEATNYLLFLSYLIIRGLRGKGWKHGWSSSADGYSNITPSLSTYPWHSWYIYIYHECLYIYISRSGKIFFSNIYSI